MIKFEVLAAVHGAETPIDSVFRVAEVHYSIVSFTADKLPVWRNR